MGHAWLCVAGKYAGWELDGPAMGIACHFSLPVVWGFIESHIARWLLDQQQPVSSGRLNERF